MPLEDAMLTQRSIRRVRPDPVDDAIVLRCVELALRAPTGGNGQNWEFIVVKDPAVKARLARENRRAWKLYRRLGAPGQTERPISVKIVRATDWHAGYFAEVPAPVVCCRAA